MIQLIQWYLKRRIFGQFDILLPLILNIIWTKNFYKTSLERFVEMEADGFYALL